MQARSAVRPLPARVRAEKHGPRQIGEMDPAASPNPDSQAPGQIETDGAWCARGKRGRSPAGSMVHLNLFLAEPVERTGQGFRNLLGSLVLNLPALEHEYHFPGLQQRDRRGR